MSRISRHSVLYQAVRYYMVCDEPDCDYEEGGEARTEAELKLYDFHRRGWYIAPFFGDCCPKCVRAGRAIGRLSMRKAHMRYPNLGKLIYSHDGLTAPPSAL